MRWYERPPRGPHGLHQYRVAVLCFTAQCPNDLGKNPNKNHNHNQFFQRNPARPACQEVLCNGDKTFSNGYLGYCNDEERSEMRYVMRIAEPRESSNL